MCWKMCVTSGFCEKCGEGHGEVRCGGSVSCALEVFSAESMEPLWWGVGKAAGSCHHRSGSWGPLSLSVGLNRLCDLGPIVPHSGPCYNMRCLFSSKFYNLRCLHGGIQSPSSLSPPFPVAS